MVIGVLIAFDPWIVYLAPYGISLHGAFVHGGDAA
jgi:hypothetical protein